MTREEQDARLETYRHALNRELREAVARHLVGFDGLALMLKYHLGWLDGSGNAVDLYAGKQIRPLLLLLSAQTAGGEWRRALAAAAAIELLHNFSLIHDDIEDSSPLRRGRATLWSVWGIGNAINAGDTMFALAHAALLDLSRTDDVPPERVLRILEVFERTNIALTNGQHLDMLFERQRSVSIEDYLQMIGGKSAALISAAMEIGALVAGLEPSQAAQYSAVGYHLGLAFQIQDDILGIWGDPETTGKSAATDIVARKKSLPVLCGLARDAEIEALYAKEYLDETDVVKVVSRLESVGARADAEQRVTQYFDLVEAGFAGLHVIDHATSQFLKALILSLMSRGV